MFLVIGSGPSAVACAHALVAGDTPVTILDSGLTLEAERQAEADALAHSDTFHTHDISTTASSFGAATSSGDRVPDKLVHGSDYPYRLAPGATKIVQHGGVAIHGSCAEGGLSNVWGGAVLPFRQQDLAGWPIAEKDLEPGFTEISKLLPIAGEVDQLSELFPFFGASPIPVRRSRQADCLLGRLARHRSNLERAGMAFGRARLALDVQASGYRGDCIYCARCLHGCPRDLIYSSRHSLKTLVSNRKVMYRRGVTVVSVEESSDRVKVHAVDPDGCDCSFEASRVFLAAGVFNSTAILLRSRNQYDRPIRIKDTQYFVFPLLQFAGTRDVVTERLHTLSQVFLEISDPSISEHLIHLQIYTYNDHLKHILDQKLGPLRCVVSSKAILGRLLLVQAYLHSDHSPGIKATLRRDGTSDALHVEPIGNPETEGKVRAVLGKLRRSSRAIGATPVDPLLQITAPGRGFHSGGSFPMMENPGPGQTDRLGRPHGMRRLHVVDSTVFPTIPAPTITFTVMANAYRIGSEASVLETDAAQ